MRSRALLLEAHHTTHIEGTRLTLEQTERLLAGEAVAGTDPDDVRELLKYRDAFEFVSDYLNDGGPVNRRTLQRDLRSLVQQGVAKTVGAARTVRYQLRIKRL